MAKVKIQGHASGTGVLTVTAPNTSTDRTITLPDSTGTLVENSTTDALTTRVNSAGGRKNLIINGGFDVWQRGTSLAGANKYLADRWFNTTSGTQSRQTFTVGQTDVPHNPTYYYRQVTGSSEWYETRQKIENVALTSGREVTLSYWMKGSSAFTNAPYRVQNFGSGGSSEVSAALTTASVTTSWAKYTQTFTLPSVSGKTIGAGSYLQIHILRANLNNITVDIANVQLEYGNTATDFEQRSYGEELTLCQRYFHQQGREGSNAYEHFFIVTAHSSTHARAVYFLPTTMRTFPTISADGDWQTVSGITLSTVSLADGGGNTGVGLEVAGSGFSSGSSYMIRSKNDSDAYIQFNAEL
jgi:hypothetical protein